MHVPTEIAERVAKLTPQQQVLLLAAPEPVTGQGERGAALVSAVCGIPGRCIRP